MLHGLRPRAAFVALLAAAGLAACSSDAGTGPDDGGGNGDGSTALTSGTPLASRAGGENSSILYRVEVPSGATLLSVTTSGGTGDLDLYVRRGATPTTAAYDCESAGGDNDELCEVDGPAAGTWYILLVGFEAYSGVTLTAAVSTGTGGQAAVCGGTQGANLAGDWRRAGDFGAPNAAGMLVRHASGQGIIVENPGTGFAIGEVKWHTFSSSACTIQSLFTNESGTTQEYRSTSVSLNAAETQLTIGQAIYNRE